jgi:AraC-like DNA-binding protein
MYAESPKHALGFYIDAVMKCQHLPVDIRYTAVKDRIVSLLAEISLMQDEVASNNVEIEVETAQDARIRTLLMYINDNIRQPLPLELLARKLLLNKNYLNDLFKRETKLTIGQYIKRRRLLIARMDINKGVPPGEAAYCAGFNDYSSFYRAYKSLYGAAPMPDSRANSAIQP